MFFSYQCSQKTLRILSTLSKQICNTPVMSKLFQGNREFGSLSKLYDPEQVKLMSEQCILIDNEDNCIGPISKRECHDNLRIKNERILHRAFSVFLFNNSGKLLLQQRSAEKITFPLYWTNTCCSHPLYTDSELEEKDNLGVKRAARRKLEHELGIVSGTIAIEDFIFLTRIHYLAESDTEWGEHEIDHIIFVKQDVEFIPNPNEVLDTKYVTQEELKQLVIQQKNDSSLKITPWFQLIIDNSLYSWWDQLDNIINSKHLPDKEETMKIHRFISTQDV